MKLYNCEQRSAEWFAVRNLKLTASHAQEIATVGKGLDTYVIKILAEYFSNNKEEKFASMDMLRGVALEDEAKLLYELETGTKIDKIGFVELNEFVGCSPDGLVGVGGGVEVKCHKAEVFLKLICDGNIDSGYEWQIEMNLLVTGRQWFDYVGYNPNFKRSLFIKRFYPNPERQAKLMAGFEIGKQKLQEKLKLIHAFIGDGL